MVFPSAARGYHRGVDHLDIAERLGPSVLRLIHASHHGVPPGRGFAHAHAALEIAYHRRGLGTTVFADGRATPFAEHCIEIYPAGLCHRQDMAEPGIDHFVHLDTPSAFAEAVPYLSIPALEDPALRQELVELTAQRGSADPLERLARDHRITAVALRLLALAMRARPASPAAAERHARAARRCIEERFADLEGVAAIAAQVGISEDRLRHAFAETFGHGLLEALTTVRLEHARALLRGSRLPVAAVGRQCGFRDPAYFSRIYRRWAGIPPGAERTSRGIQT